MPAPAFTSAWRSAFRDRAFALEFAISLAVAIPVFALTMHVLNWVETRAGVSIPDPLQALFAPVDVTWLTFALIYGGLFGALAVLLRNPRLFLFGGQAYMLLTLLRLLSIWLTPLAPPEGIIPLKDPVVQMMAGTDQVLLRDLFFSGHTSLPFLIFLIAPGRRLRWAFFGLSVSIGALVVLQHVHYTIDVLAAPAASLATRGLIRRLRPGGAERVRCR